MLAVNSTGPGNIAVSSADGVRLTTDAGATFRPQAILKPPPGYMSDGDTDLKFDGQGRLFWSNLAFTSSGDEGICVSQINPTTGASITSVMATKGPSDDKPFMTIDTNPASPFFNNIYLVFTRFNVVAQVFFSRSADQARTWSSPLQLSNAPREGLVSFSDVSVAPNGDVYVAITRSYSSRRMAIPMGPPARPSCFGPRTAASHSAKRTWRSGRAKAMLPSTTRPMCAPSPERSS
jgi:hypothetical protein